VVSGSEIQILYEYSTPTNYTYTTTTTKTNSPYLEGVEALAVWLLGGYN